MTSINKNEYSIGASGVFTIFITIGTLLWYDVTRLPQEYGWTKTFFFIGLALFIALIGGDTKRVVELLVHILNVNNSGKDDLEKALLIRNNLDLCSAVFQQVFTDVRKTINGQLTWKRFWENQKSLYYKVLNGKITLDKGIWLFLYMVYLIFIQTNYYDIPLPYNIIITVFFIMGLQMLSDDEAGMGQIIASMYKDATKTKEADDEETQKLINSIIDSIRILCIKFEGISKDIESTTGQPIRALLYPAMYNKEKGTSTA